MRRRRKEIEEMQRFERAMWNRIVILACAIGIFLGWNTLAGLGRVMTIGLLSCLIVDRIRVIRRIGREKE